MKELERYLLLDFPVKLKSLKVDSERQFGEMNVIQMLDHLRKAFLLSYSGKEVEIKTAPEHIDRAQAFLDSDRPIRPGAQVPDVYFEVEDMEEEFEEMKLQLIKEMIAMLSFFDKNPDWKQAHSTFGLMNVKQWLQLHKKHTEHHLRQFGIDN